jgi:ribosome maturation factor RimP
VSCVIAQQRLLRARAWVEAFLQPLADERYRGKISAEVYLVDFVMRNVNGRDIVELYVDTDNGITIGECTWLTRLMLDALEHDLEAQEIFGDNLRLEISSPGVSRPLLLPRQYKKNIGRRLRIRYVDADAVMQVVEGTLLAVKNLDSSDAAIELDTSPKKSATSKKRHMAASDTMQHSACATLVLPLHCIKEAIVQIEF